MSVLARAPRKFCQDFSLRWFCPLIFLLGFVFSFSLNHSVLVEPEADITQREYFEQFKDPFDWDKKFVTISPQIDPIVRDLTMSLNPIDVFSSHYFKVHPFFSLAIPPPRTNV